MKPSSRTKKIVALCLVMALIAGCLETRLAYLQLVKGQTYSAQAERKTLRTYNEKASRGEIYDRNGQPLVTNSVGFSVVFDYFTWDTDRQNEIILTVCRMLDSAGAEHNDTLPISRGQPFTYTYASEESTGATKLKSFLKDQKKWPQEPTAPELFGLLCEKYEVDESLSTADKRTIIGVRYEMQIREFSSYAPFTLATDVDIATVSRISERNFELPGVNIATEDVREYRTDYAAHILGRVDIIYKEEYAELKEQGYAMDAIIGKDGMEKALEPYLREIDGERAVETDVSGSVINEFVTEEPQPGKNCYLTLDIGMQEVAENALASTIENIRQTGANSRTGRGADAEGGAVVVIDVHSGEILALASYPTYSLKTYRKDYNSLLENELSPLYNRAIQGAYAPGSTFKMVTALAGLEEGVVTPNTRIRDEGRYMYYAPSYTPACWIWNDYRGTHGNINVSEAIKYSCNYFFYEVARLVGIDTLDGYASKLGLGQKTGVELEGERSGNLAGPESREAKGETWWAGDTIQAGIGQSDHQFTPIQLANYVATIVNGGTRYRAHLLKEVKNYSNTETVETVEPEVLSTIEMSESSRRAIMEGMRDVTTEDGTASSYFRNFPIAVGGKTGSAQTTSDRSAHGVFVSFAPYDEPEIAVCVVGEHAGSGGSMAPVAIEIYNYYFKLGKYAPDYQEPTEGDGQAGAGGSGNAAGTGSQTGGQTGTAAGDPTGGNQGGNPNGGGQPDDPAGSGANQPGGSGSDNPGGDDPGGQGGGQAPPDDPALPPDENGG